MVRKLSSSLLAVAAACSLAACAHGDAAGSSDAGPWSSEKAVMAAASEMSFEQNAFSPGEVAPSIGTGQAPGQTLSAPSVCHPELFARSIEYSEMLNFHVNQFLLHVDVLLQEAPTQSGDMTTWQERIGEADLRLQLTETSPGVYDAALALAAPGRRDFVTVVSGAIDESNPDDVIKRLAFDLDAMHEVFPAADTDLSSGKLTMSTERARNAEGSDVWRDVEYSLDRFTPITGDSLGPRSGTISLVDEPGVGGAMLYAATTVFLCPPNPASLPTDARTHARWRVRGNVVSGRADAIAVGGPMASGNRWVGSSCLSHSLGTSAGHLVDDNGYWVMKEEDPWGATVTFGPDSAVQDTSSTDGPCDPTFGPLIDLSDSASDPVIQASLPIVAFPAEL